MTPTKRIQDMLPALIVFAIVAAFGTYATIAYVARDPWWLNTLVELRQEHGTDARAKNGRPARHDPAGQGTRSRGGR